MQHEMQPAERLAVLLQMGFDAASVNTALMVSETIEHAISLLASGAIGPDDSPSVAKALQVPCRQKDNQHAMIRTC